MHPPCRMPGASLSLRQERLISVLIGFAVLWAAGVAQRPVPVLRVSERTAGPGCGPPRLVLLLAVCRK